ncbi:single-strand DNA-binding protein [Mucilaginibacter gracilis]|uniref:Single-strand DNA-binding protein n=1 Tax=Mucilaginibacter gracilis TaxID=423350 RepID=A0A495IV97_9SPHI|nr:single-stranded DNA-binding protein [Mucilaginibacter gracilis]RKR80675.1 single-strand DNA-binding protein [Mucilaginibacter gracilis]
MQQITGRITADATVKTLDGGKQVVNFSIVDNDTYKPKGSSEPVKVATFFNCSYWLNANVIKVLRKGAVVRLDGRLSARGYTTNTNDIGASLDFHTSYIKVLAYSGAKEDNANVAAPVAAGKESETDDLPF